MNNSLNKIEQTFSWSNAVCKKVSNFQWLEIVIIINIFSYQSNCFIWKELNIYSLQKKNIENILTVFKQLFSHCQLKIV